MSVDRSEHPPPHPPRAWASRCGTAWSGATHRACRRTHSPVASGAAARAHVAAEHLRCDQGTGVLVYDLILIGLDLRAPRGWWLPYWTGPERFCRKTTAVTHGRILGSRAPTPACKNLRFALSVSGFPELLKKQLSSHWCSHCPSSCGGFTTR